MNQQTVNPRRPARRTSLERFCAALLTALSNLAWSAP